MKMLARQCVYWQGIDRTIEDLVKSCDACQKAAKMPIKNILSPWPEPSHAWERIHIDFAGPMENAMFFIVVDAYSKWPEVIQMKTITSTGTICVLSKMFARYGFPETLVSDNGTQHVCRIRKILSDKFNKPCKDTSRPPSKQWSSRKICRHV